MTSGISGTGACSPAASAQTRGAAPAKLQQQLLAKVDSNGDKAIDKSELKSFMDFVGTQSGTQAGDTDALFSALDADSDGSITGAELADNGKALFDQLREQLRGSQLAGSANAPPPPPPENDSSELFASIDADSDGSISATEFETAMSQRTQGPGRGQPPEEGGQIGRILASLIQQYSAVSSASASETSLSAVA